LRRSPDSTLKALRREHADWFLYWREGVLYAVPRTLHPATSIGNPTTLSCRDYLPLIVALIDDLLPRKFPAYEAFRRRPFQFIGKKDEMIGAITKDLRNLPPLVHQFSIRPVFTLQAKILEPAPGETSIGLFLTIQTKWEINADIAALQAARVNLRGLYVVRRDPQPDERRLVGMIESVTDKVVSLAASYNNRASIGTDEVFLEGSRTSFVRCMKCLLGRDYETFEQLRQREEKPANCALILLWQKSSALIFLPIDQKPTGQRGSDVLQTQITPIFVWRRNCEHGYTARGRAPSRRPPANAILSCAASKRRTFCLSAACWRL
jgi:hypothetical protein